MKLIIKQKMSGTGTIHDIRSEHYDREVFFEKGRKFAIVLASHYGDEYFTYETESELIDAYYSNELNDYSKEAIDLNGNYLEI